MEQLGKPGTIVAYTWGSAFVVRAVAGWVIGATGALLVVATVVAALLGALVGMAEARALAGRDDPTQLAGGLAGAALAVACLFVLMPWGLLAALAVAAATVLGLSRLDA